MLKAKVNIHKYQHGDAEWLLSRGLREADKREAKAITGGTPEQALLISIEASELVVSMFRDDNIMAIFGVAQSINGAGAPWLLGHDDFEKADTNISVARISKRFIDHWFAYFGRLENIADPEHKKSIPYLTWLGFTFDWGNMLTGPFGDKLVRFWR